MSDTCLWKELEDDDCGNYDTSCGQTFAVIDSTPEENGFRFCCYCGKPITVEHSNQNVEEDEP